MIFYLIPAANGQYEELAGTQADARQLCKNKGIKFDADAMQHYVPTSKWDLINYINVLMAKAAGHGPVRGVDGPFDMDDSGQPIADIPEPRHMSQRQVDAMFEPTQKTAKLTPDDVDQICILISEMRGAAIGHVAHSLAARVECLGKVAANV